jgi:subtilisin-like proprotein convertase family protein
VNAAPATAMVFSNPEAISIPTSGRATPYPSTISVSGLAGRIYDVTASLDGFAHNWPDDVDVMLVSPAGTAVVLMSDVGGGRPVADAGLVFDDFGNYLPDDGQIVSGRWLPTVGTLCDTTCGFGGPAPDPNGTRMSDFDYSDPNGTWSLYVYDDLAGFAGSIAGWSLDIVTKATMITDFRPKSGPPGTSVDVAGTNLSGATAVTFGGTPAESFTIRSNSRIRAVVPAAAATGPIAVTTSLWGTGTSSADFTVVPVPTITSFSPKTGKVGASVAITGTELTGATAVEFNGTDAPDFIVSSPTEIIATVPAGAATGPVSVTTPGGTAVSSSDFVVKHERVVSLSTDGEAEGTVTVADDFAACASEVPVDLQRRVEGGWRTVSHLLTDASGSYSVDVSEEGRHRAVARGVTLDSGDRCLKGVSPTVVK